MDDYRELKVEADTFEKMRNDANYVLQRALGTMKEKESMEGKVTITLDIKMVQEYVPNFDPEVEGETRKILKPKFEHKVTSAINIKNEKKGNIEPEMAMVWDEDSQSYVLTYVNNTDQRSIFDTDFQDTMNSPESDGGIETSSERDYLSVALIEGEVADEGALPGEVVDETALPCTVDEDEYEDREQSRGFSGISDEEDTDDGFGYEDVV